MRPDYARVEGEQTEGTQAIGATFQVLTTREAEVASLIAQGKSSKEIAAFFKLSLWTVADHRKNICRKLDVHSTAELMYVVTRGEFGAQG